MNLTRPFLIVLVALAFSPPPARADKASDHFEAKVRPLLAAHCLKCHGQAKEGGLRVDSREAILKGGESGPAIIPGNPAKSLLIQAVSRKHDRKMPPKNPLADRQVKALVRWVREGAVWPKASPRLIRFAISEQQRRFWSFQPVKKPAIPKRLGELQKADPSTTPLDAFVFSRQSQRGLAPNGRADARTLIRRATYDLIGLAPTPREVNEFQKEFRREPRKAFRRLVDRLLDSPQYGERWGRHWLDLARYADTAGDASDFPVPEAYKYRNYVIDAMNKDKPYDQFIREQIAGDLLPAENDDQRWEQTIATGYVAVSRRIGVSPHNLRHIMIEDTIGNLGTTFLGLTLGCARCHDHKFDPIPTSDYYALYGFFDSSIYPHAGAEHKPWRQDFVYRIGVLASDELLREHREVLEQWNRKERAKLEEYRDFQRKKIDDPNRSREQAWREVLAVREERRQIAEAFPDLEVAYALQDGEPRDAHVQGAGDPRSPGELVRRGFPQILGGQKLPPQIKGSGRRQLADWIADKRNPLTARVMVNRIWRHHFGRGLVATTSDFGFRGSRPSHPELLDYLAASFVEGGWSIKAMHRLIMNSRTYQLAVSDQPKHARIDPENILLWRSNRRRLDAEQIRDSLLQFSGQLDMSMGGRHPFPHRLTYFYRQHEPFVGDFPTLRRSVYMMQQRIKKNDYLDLFDGPDGNLSLADRRATTTTLQALFLMNSEFVHQQSMAIVKRLMSEASDRDGRLDLAYRMIFARPPNGAERSRAARYFEQSQNCAADEEAGTALAWAGFVRGMVSSNEFMFLD